MAGPRWLDGEEQRAWRTLVAVPRLLMARLDADLQRRRGMSLPDYEVLVHLSEAPDRSLRMADLAERLVLSPSGLTRRLDGLVRQRLVERRACPSDGRGSFAVLTDDGSRRLEDAAAAHLDSVRSYVVERLARHELLALAAAMARIGEAVEVGPPASQQGPG
jgi:DNA-binding MarR family transcriptional regulator